jgi:VWFA-related protein
MNKTLASLPLALLLSLPLAPVAQQPATPVVAAKQPIVLDILVTKSGKPVPNLTQQDFTALDNAQPSKVLVFHQHNLADVPAGQVDASTNLIIILDQVNTPYDKVTFARQGIQQFLKQNNGYLNHPVTLGFFTEKGLEMQTQPSIDGNALSAAIDKQEQGYRILGNGAQYGGAQRMTLSLNAIDTLIVNEKTRPGRKVILWVSPGWALLAGPQNVLTPGQQQQTLDTAIRLSTSLRQARITLYSIYPLGLAGVGTGAGEYYKSFLKPLTDPSKASLANLSLQVLVTQSGGRVLFGNDLILNYLNKAVTDLSAFYTLAINPAPSTQPNQFHTLDIKLSNPRLEALTRNGYYAQP